MLKTSGHVKKHYKPCCIIFEEFKNKNGDDVTFDKFIYEVSKYSKSLIKDERNTFVGDMLEVFAEVFFNAFANDPAIGLVNYTPVPLVEDYGVDGLGTNAAGTPCVVQVKFRNNPLDLVTYSEVAKTFSSGVLQKKIPLDKSEDNIFIFTSANGVTVACETVFSDKLRVLNRSIISNKVDNNVGFWNFAFETIKTTLLKRN